MTENENNCKCAGKVEKVIVRVPGPQGGKGETGPQGELNPADKEFIAQKAQEAAEAATGAENAKDKAEESRGAAESAQNAALASQEAAKSSEDAAAESAAQAEESEGAAGNSATVAANAESGARTAASAAAVSAGEAEKASGVAGQAKTDAVAAKDAAEVAQAGAETSAASAKDSADKAAVALKDTQAEKTDALAKINATVTQAKSDIQAQVTVATTQATTATQAATTATQKATEADQSAKAAEAAKASAETSASTATEQAGIATEKAEALTEAMGSLTTLSNDAVRFTAQEKTDTEKYQARLNIGAEPGTSAAAHNGIYRGKDLTSVYTIDQLSAKVKKGDFSDLFIGDYITKDVTVFGKTYFVNWIFADFDYQLNAGDTPCTAHHIVMIPNGGLGTAKMNDSDAITGGYVNSKMWKTMIPEVATGLKNAFGAAHVLSFRTLLSSDVSTTAASMAGAGRVGCSTGWTWYDCLCNLLSEPQAYGTHVHGSSFYDIGERKTQFALFRHDTHAMNVRSAWWLSAVSYSSGFCYVSYLGNALAYNATEVLGVRPYFLFH